MIDSARRGFIKTLALFAALTLGLTAGAPQASAQGLFNQIRYAAIVVDASDGEVLYAKRADDLRYPASITKIMTLYLTFEALSTGRLTLSEPIPVSAHAASMAPSKTQLRAGDRLSVDDAIRVVAVQSANDIAVALAEKIGGSESRFASLMSLRAQELGMANSRFVNANGLPDNRQVTTARDIAILSRAVMRDYPQYYHYFGERTAQLRGQNFTNHNHLLREPGYDGFKTGFTNAAGYNLSASAVRDGRRLITVVLGGSSSAARNENVQTLMNAGFDVLRKRTLGQHTTIASNIAEPEDSAPIQPGVEQGDGGRSGLTAVVVDSLHAAPVGDQLAEEEQQSAISAPPPGLGGRVTTAKADPCAQGASKRRRGAHRATACKSAPVQTAAIDCSKKHGRAKRVCDRGQSSALAKAAAPKARRHGAIALAKAGAAKARPHHGRRRHAEA